MSSLPPPPIKDPNTSSYVWQDWFRQLRNRANAALTTVTWRGIDFTGSNLTDILTKDHNVLTNKQGGTTGEYYHLTSNEYTGGSTSNIDAAKLQTKTWAVPAAIGSTTPAAGTFTTLASTGNTTIGDSSSDGFTINPSAVTWANNPTHSGNHTFSGNITINGNTTLGDSTSDLTKVSGNLVMPKTSGYGIQVDTSSPSFGWRDLLGQIQTRGVGASDPDWVAYRGNVYQYQFKNAHLHEAWLNFHIPHDYVPGSDLYVHVHWSEITVDTGGTAGVPGNAKWYFDISYADGHGTAGGSADPFIAPITVSVVQQGSTTQYGHMIAEVQFTNNGGTGGLIDSNTIQVDGLVLVRIYRDPADVADTLNQDPFVHMVNLHYQSNNMATKNKAPNFYS